MAKYQNYYGSTRAKIWQGDTAVSFSIDRKEAKELRRKLFAFLHDDESTNKLYFNLYPKKVSKRNGLGSISVMSMKTLAARG